MLPLCDHARTIYASITFLTRGTVCFPAAVPLPFIIIYLLWSRVGNYQNRWQAITALYFGAFLPRYTDL